MSNAATREDVPHLQPLTVVRFLAAMHVLLYHAVEAFSGATLLKLPGPCLQIIEAGYTSVSVFFILSGFILAYNYLQTDFREADQARRFWISRLARIYPVYLFGLLIAAPKYVSSLLNLGPLEQAAPHAATSVAVLGLLQSWLPGSALAWNPPAWSLSAEAFFYLLFPALALLISRVKSRPVAITGAVVCWLMALIPPTLFTVIAPETESWVNVLKFNPLLRLPEFVMGIFLGKIFSLRIRSTFESDNESGRSLKWFGAVVLVTLSALAVHGHIPKAFVHNGLFDPLFALLLFALASAGSNRRVRAFCHPALIRLGEASYALYILHIPIKGWLMGGIKTLHLSRDPRTLSMLLVVYVASTVVISLLTYRFIEVPARRFLKGWLLPRRRAQPAPDEGASLPVPLSEFGS
jgi:peptidoglycan/LPS O-acetylase OafA/YrhL